MTTQTGAKITKHSDGTVSVRIDATDLQNILGWARDRTDAAYNNEELPQQTRLFYYEHTCRLYDLLSAVR